MEAKATAFPAAGIVLSPNHDLYVVDLGNIMKSEVAPERRAFLDVAAAVQFIDGRAARLSALLAPLGQSSEAAVFGLIEEVFQSTHSKTFLLRFSNSPSLLVKCSRSTHPGEFEPFQRIYPPTGADL